MDEDELVDVKATEPYKLEVTFANGCRSCIDIESELWGQMFEPLRDPKAFMEARFDSEIGTVVWPNGADLSPEFLVEAALAASS